MPFMHDHTAKQNKYQSGNYESKLEERPVQRMSRLLEPIAVQR